MPKLDRYQEMRDFAQTSEPAGGASESGGDPRFVVQQHSARRIHWDLRLEHEGVAASWAVPNGIPMDPGENRKAVHTEDHPVEYLEFAGVIPQGNYGAGTMEIWDSGTYELAEWSEGKVVVVFHGERVRGRYALFRTGGEGRDWMIHRIDPPQDPNREPFPARIVPMLARAETLPRNESAFGFEVKWDGVRAIVYARPGRLRIESRNLLDITSQYPEIRSLSRALGAHEAVLDGEIVAFDELGRPSFERLQQRMHLDSDSQIRRRAQQLPATLVIFDLLYLDGHSLMARPYSERRAELERLELDGEAWRTPAAYPGEGRRLLEASAAQGLEGVVAKRLDSGYEPGARNGAWIKIKNKRSAQLVIGGWLPGEGRRRNRIGALLVGYHAPDGALRYGGRVGSGFSDSELRLLGERLGPLERPSSPFDGDAKISRGALFVEPKLVAEVEFTEWTREGLLRHPVYKGLRAVDPAKVVLGSAEPERAPARAQAQVGRPATPGKAGGETPSIGPLRPSRKGAFETTVEDRWLRLTNLDKVLYPRTGFTKGELIDYYAGVAPVLLPHLHGRPLTLKRYPNGVEGKYFYEKQCPSHRPDWVRTQAVYSRSNRRNIDFCLANDLPTLVWAANLADIELHTSMSRAADIEHPTMMVFDLDPGAPADIVQCCQVALWLRELFDPLDLAAYPKTSGSKGLQVYVPLNSGATYDATKPFAKAVAELLEKQHPAAVVSRMSKELRPGKVLVDWSQNDEHKTTVCVYSLRAKERPTVSTPVTWDEVVHCLDSGDPDELSFDWRAVLARVERGGDLFAETLTLAQELPRL
ncbi:MAG: DNA ligase D [Thermoleophilaceae bacterium]